MGKNVHIKCCQQKTENARFSGVPVIEAHELFQDFQEVRIQYRKDEYRLRITKNQKLILTK
jgi:hemin uptake protein HemP